MAFAPRARFVYYQSVNVEEHPDAAVAGIAAAIGDLSRARMLYCLSDGLARTSTELAIVAGVTPSTACVHLQRLEAQRLVKVFAQGRHRYYSLEGRHVAAVLESLSVLAGGKGRVFTPNRPNRLRAARTCYDHIAGALGVALHDRFRDLGWLAARPGANQNYDLTQSGEKALAALGIDVEAARAQRRRFAYGCLDWSERRPHVAGAIGAALLHMALKRRWVVQELDSRALTVTRTGRRELLMRFGLPQ